MTGFVHVCSALVLVTLAAGTVSQTARQAIRETTGMSGMVLTSDEPSRPVRQAIVTLTRVDGNGTATWSERRIGDSPATLTNDEGRFTFSPIPSGRYRVSVTKPAFLTAEFGAPRPGEPGTAVAVTDGAIVTDVSIRLVRGAVITGTLRNPDGSPAVNTAVSAMSAEWRGGFAISDDRGVYRIFSLPAGDYVISSTLVSSFSPGEQSSSVSVADVDAALELLARRYGAVGVAGPSGLPPASRVPQRATPVPIPPFRPIQLAPTFYPGTVIEGSAIRVKVAAGETRDSVDFQLVLAGTVEVAGLALLPDGRPVMGAVVSVGVGRVATTAADGTFRVSSVSPGPQILSARVSPSSSALASRQPLTPAADASSRQVAMWALENIDVPMSGLSGVRLTLRPGMTLSGTVAFAGTSLASPQYANVQVRLITREASGLATIRGDGSFEVSGLLPGVSQITGTVVGAPAPGWWLRSAMLGERDLLDLPLELGAATGDVRGVVLTFSDRHTEIAGILETPAGAPATEYVVAAVSAERRLWHPQSRRLAFTRPATDGRYSFRDLPPGTYVIVALTDLDPASWRNATVLEPLIGAGVQVVLAEGGRIQQNLQIAK